MFEKLWEYLKDRFSLWDFVWSLFFSITLTIILYPSVAPLEDHEIVSVVFSISLFVLFAMHFFKTKILKLDKKDKS